MTENPLKSFIYFLSCSLHLHPNVLSEVSRPIKLYGRNFYFVGFRCTKKGCRSDHWFNFLVGPRYLRRRGFNPKKIDEYFMNNPKLVTSYLDDFKLDSNALRFMDPW